MGASPADNANNHATSSSRIMREESLLRSFSAIQHRSSTDDGASPRLSHDGRIKRDRRGRRSDGRRTGHESAHLAGHRAAGPPSHRASHHAAKPSPTSGAVAPPLSDVVDGGMPPLPFTELRRDSSEGTSGSRERRQPKKFRRRHSPVTTEEEQHKGFRRDYSIGESLRRSSHVVAPPSAAHAVAAVDTLNKHDFAFVKRSDGSYSYAILAYRSMERMRNTDEVEECMVFVMTEIGSTKMIRKKHWGQLVRLVSTEHPADASPRSPDRQHVRERSVLLCREVETAPPFQRCEDGQEGPLPNVIAFVQGADEECSMISSVSDRARLLRRRC